MLLTALYEKACRDKLLETLHIQRRVVHIVIPLDAAGRLKATAVIPLYSQDKAGNNVLGQEIATPRFAGENNGGKAYFITEACGKILGIDPETGRGVRLGAKLSNQAKAFQHYWWRVEQAWQATRLPTLLALLEFKKQYIHAESGCVVPAIPFVRLAAGDGSPTAEVDVSGELLPIAKITATFAVDDQPVFTASPDDQLGQYWEEEYRRQAFADDEQANEGDTRERNGVCLVSGRAGVTVARSHKPKILGVPGAQSGGYIVSCASECPAFSSYGCQMGENAPVSEEAAAAYALALQGLIKSQHNSFKTGSAIFCFWVKDASDDAAFFHRMLCRPDPAEVEQFLKAPLAGADRSILHSDQFYAVSLSANQGRIVVRQWLQEPLDQARANLRRWFEDLDIVSFSSHPAFGHADTPNTIPPLSLPQLAGATTRDPKKLDGDTVARLYGAALAGSAPPSDTIVNVMERLRSDIACHGCGVLETPIPAKTLKSMRKSKQPVPPSGQSRMALLKLILRRPNGIRKGGHPMIDSKIFETDDPAYNCGRLLAILADAQDKAHEYSLEGPGVAERYFGTASVSPSSVFPILLRLNRHHLNKIRKSDRYRSHAGPIEGSIKNVVVLFRPAAECLPPQFPRHLDLQAQGRFAIGFYQQMADTDARRAEAKRQKDLSAK